MDEKPDQIYQHALKLLHKRDYTVEQMREKLCEKFKHAPAEVLQRLISKGFLNDRRFAENAVLNSGDCHPSRVREELTQAGVPLETIQKALDIKDWPSLTEVLNAKINASGLRPPLDRREAARLFRTLSRLGYQEDEIREELEQFHE